MGKTELALRFMMDIGTGPSFMMALASRLMLPSNCPTSPLVRFLFLAKRTTVSAAIFEML